ncbi:MAG: sortase [Ruminococcus sp.]|nr:sortase [Ruminococcus sp.]
MNNRAVGRFLIACGTLLLLAAVSLVVYNLHRSSSAEKASKEKAELIRQYINSNVSTESESSPTNQKEPSNPQEPALSQPEYEPEAESSEPLADEALELDGEFYIGLLAIPALGLELPVIRDYSLEKMDIAVCRYMGSLEGGDMIICGHNFSCFFSDLYRLQPGDEIIFTNIKGQKIYYTVGWQELISGWATGDMPAGSDSWDLTLFTCTWNSRSRVTVRAVRNE